MSKFFTPIKTANLIWLNGMPFSQDFADIYYSQENGLAERRHTFIEGNRLLERWQSLEQSAEGGTFTIAETGFGTALNFLLTWSLWLDHAPPHARLHYISCEKFPLKLADLKRSLNLWPQLRAQGASLLANYPILTPGFHQLIFAEGRINLTLMLGDATQCYQQLLLCGDSNLELQIRTNCVNAWFLDGFAPAKNQEMWSRDLLHSIALLSTPGTTVATFSTAGMVKENLQKVGFAITKVKGYGRKRSMLTARLVKEPVSGIERQIRTTPWHVNSDAGMTKPKTAIIIGAGLAGCYLAHALAKRDWQVKLIEAHHNLAGGASGNQQAVLYPKFSAYSSPLTDFMLTAFLFASRVYTKFLAHDKTLGELSGLIQLASNSREEHTQAHLKSWLSAYPALGKLIGEEEASLMAGLPLDSGGLFIPYGGWLNSAALCQSLVEMPGIELIASTTVKELRVNRDQWQVGDHLARITIVATGHEAKRYRQTAYLPLKSIRGQMTHIAATEHSEKLKLVLCAEGHLVPAYNKLHSLGASYSLNCEEPTAYAKDDQSNLAKVAKISPAMIGSVPVSNWAGVRGVTPDYLPLVGPVAKKEAFNQRFAALATNSKRWLPFCGEYHPGLYVCAGFGSRGLTTIPISAEWLAAHVNNEPSFLPRSMVQSLAPARFLLKKIIRRRGK